MDTKLPTKEAVQYTLRHTLSRTLRTSEGLVKLSVRHQEFLCDLYELFVRHGVEAINTRDCLDSGFAVRFPRLPEIQIRYLKTYDEQKNDLPGELEFRLQSGLVSVHRGVDTTWHPKEDDEDTEPF